MSWCLGIRGVEGTYCKPSVRNWYGKATACSSPVARCLVQELLIAKRDLKLSRLISSDILALEGDIENGIIRQKGRRGGCLYAYWPERYELAAACC